MGSNYFKDTRYSSGVTKHMKLQRGVVRDIAGELSATESCTLKLLTVYNTNVTSIKKQSLSFTIYTH